MGLNTSYHVGFYFICEPNTYPQEVYEGKFCPTCDDNEKRHESSKFCDECGTELEERKKIVNMSERLWEYYDIDFDDDFKFTPVGNTTIEDIKAIVMNTDLSLIHSEYWPDKIELIVHRNYCHMCIEDDDDMFGPIVDWDELSKEERDELSNTLILLEKFYDKVTLKFGWFKTVN